MPALGEDVVPLVALVVVVPEEDEEREVVIVPEDVRVVVIERDETFEDEVTDEDVNEGDEADDEEVEDDNGVAVAGVNETAFPMEFRVVHCEDEGIGCGSGVAASP